MYTLLSIIIRKWIFTWKDSHASLSTWCFSYSSSKCIWDTKSFERRSRRLRMRETSSKAFVLRYLWETGNGRRSFVVYVFCQIMMMRGHEMRQFIVRWIVQEDWVQQMYLMFQVEMSARKEWSPQLLSPDSSCLSLYPHHPSRRLNRIMLRFSSSCSGLWILVVQPLFLFYWHLHAFISV